VFAPPVELVFDLPEHRRVTFDHPPRNSLVVRPGRVRDKKTIRFGRTLDGLVVGAIDHEDFGTLTGDGLAPRRNQVLGNENLRAETERPRHPRHRSPVVAIRGGHERERPQGLEFRL
jgi:hypothetical protein